MAPTAPSVPPAGTLLTPPPTASPATLVPDLSFAGSVGTAVGHRSRDRYKPRFSYQARSPLPHLLVYLCLLLLAVVAMFQVDAANYDRSTTLVEATSAQESRAEADDVDSGWVLAFAGAALVGFVVMCLLVSRIGRNASGLVSGMGAWTAALSLPTWHLVAFAGVDLDQRYTWGSVLARYVFAFLLALVGYCILQARLFRRLWEAGDFSHSAWSALLWGLPAAAWLTLYSAAIYTLAAVGEDGRGTSRWEPTDRMAELTLYATAVAAVLLVLLLIAVAVSQHIGIMRDRAALRAERTSVDPPLA